VNRRAVVIAFVVAAALLGLWFVLLWGPQGGKLDDAEKRHQAADAANSALEVRLSRLKAAQARAPQLLADQETLRRAVPDGPELAQFILDANDVANEAGVDFISISPSVPELGLAGLPPDIKLSISVTGTYFAALDYLHRLEDLPRIVVVDTLGLSSGASANGARQLTIAITARMFATSAPQIATTTTTTTTVPAGQQPATTTTTATTGGTP
jgi:Tfp pilus assembly protein PilO